MKIKLLLLALFSSALTFAQVIAFSNLTSSAITNTTATLNVTLANVCSTTVGINVEYSQDFNFVNGVLQAVQSGGMTNGVNSVNVTGLVLNTRYYFRFYANSPHSCTLTRRQSASSSFFSANNPVTGPPVIALPSLQNLTTNAVEVVYFLNPGGLATTSEVQYGTNFSSTLPGVSGNTFTQVAAAIPYTGLQAGTTYSVRIRAVNSAGSVLSPVLSFTTAGTFIPIAFSNLTSSAITNTTATVSVTLANVCNGANYRLQYSTSSTFGAGTIDTQFSTGNLNGIKNHNLTGLSPNTLYYFRFYAAPNQACNNTQILSGTSSFTTALLPPPIAPTILNVSSTVTINSGTISYTLNANDNATTSVLKWGFQSNNIPNQVAGFSASGNTNTPGQATIPVNTQGTTIFYRIDATNSGGTTSSSVGNFKTLIAPTFNQVAPICAGATIATLPTTSNNGYSGTWSPALNNSTTTTYTFTPSNPSVVSAAQMTIVVNQIIIPTFTQVAPFCADTFGSPLPATSTNGVSGSWTPAFSNTTTQTYTFVPNPNTIPCATSPTMTVVITPRTIPTFNAVSIPICRSLDLTQASNLVIPQLPTTSTNGILGAWVFQQSNTATITFRFEPVATECASTTTITFNKNPLTFPVFTPIANVCAGTNFVLPITSNNGITGTWSPAINNTATTLYAFTPNANECANSTNMQVNIIAATAPIFTQIAPQCAGSTFSLPTTSSNSISGTWSPAVNNTATTNYTFTPTAGQCGTTTMTVTVNPNVTPTFAQVAPTCVGQNAAVVIAALPTTSTNGISGTWALGQNTPFGSVYNFTPAVGQCGTSTQINVGTIPAIMTAFTQVAPICAGATLAALPTTSTNGITGTWSPAINNSATTTYMFTSTPGQCATTNIPMTIVVNQVILPAFTQIAPICAGATLAALPTTSTNGITGVWSPAINNSATTTYMFTPAAGQCSNSTSMTIVVNPVISPAFTTVAPICSGQTLAALPTTSTNGISGVWSPAINNIATTTYTFTPATGQCASAATMTVTINTIATPTGSASQSFVSGTTIASLAVSPANVVWYPTSAAAVAGTNALLPSTLLVSGSTYYAVTVSGTCRSNPLAVTVSVNLGIENNNTVEFKIYPNPINDFLNIETFVDIKSIEIYNIQGQKVLQSNQKQINVSEFAAGVYMIKIQDIENATATKKFVKQ